MTDLKSFTDATAEALAKAFPKVELLRASDRSIAIYTPVLPPPAEDEPSKARFCFIQSQPSTRSEGGMDATITLRNGQDLRVYDATPQKVIHTLRAHLLKVGEAVRQGIQLLTAFDVPFEHLLLDAPPADTTSSTAHSTAVTHTVVAYGTLRTTTCAGATNG